MATQTRTKNAAPRKPVQKATSRKSASKRKTAPRRKPAKKATPSGRGWLSFSERVWPRLLPLCLGAAIVGGVCWLLLRGVTRKQVEQVFVPPEGYMVRGIDVSHHQGTINWELLRNQGTVEDYPLSFAFIKATEGGNLVDPRFGQNFAAARRHGLLRGAYHFFRPATPAKQQAELFIRNVRLLAGDLPPVLDVEVKPADVSAEDFRQGILEWLVRVEQHYGVRPILYTYHSFRQQYMNDSVFNLYPYWIAHYYVDSVRYRGPWAFWQHSDQGELPGIRGPVDLNIFNGSYEELRRMTIRE